MKNITPADLEQKLADGRAIFLKLWKKGCGACKLSEPAISRLEPIHGLSYEFVSISVDDYPEILELSETDVLPAFFVFKNGELKGNLLGFKGIKNLEDLISKDY